ncbi:hypothetical protein LSH36_23g07027 [Paralvinella palmiformis]|uniref:Uncharacterized protein n=1 Tax=Paralvinella palmiformis TaxID=53620 RepID=A0AAD9KAL1_9ANNE|nr:hypothetical protein LSH36_23g07027 [Paralvinella palmiformis]
MVITTTTTSVSVHTISFRGIAGSIFVALTLAILLYVIGFATTAWSINGAYREGLWENCRCGKIGDAQDWFHAVQAMITIGLIGLILAFLLVCIYMCVHSLSKNKTLIALVIVCFLSVVFMVIGFIIYGSKRDGLHWSFAVTVISSILCLVAGILSVVQMRQSGVRM